MRLFDELADIRLRGDRLDRHGVRAIVLARMRDDVERADADRAGGAEHGDGAGQHRLQRRDLEIRPRGGESVHGWAPNIGSRPTTMTSERQNRRGEQRGIDAVEHAAVAGDQAAAVLALEAALDPGFEEIAGMRDDGEARAEERGQNRTAADDADINRFDDRRRGDAAERSGPGLVRRQRRPQARAADQIADDERAGVGRPDRDEHADDDPGAVRLAAQQQKAQHRAADIERRRAPCHSADWPRSRRRGRDASAPTARIAQAKSHSGQRDSCAASAAAIATDDEEDRAEDALAHHAMPFARRRRRPAAPRTVRYRARRRRSRRRRSPPARRRTADA